MYIISYYTEEVQCKTEKNRDTFWYPLRDMEIYPQKDDGSTVQNTHSMI